MTKHIYCVKILNYINETQNLVKGLVVVIELLTDLGQTFIDALPYLLRLVVATVCGAGIGLERTLRQKEAGLRTHIIVALGSALMMIVSKYAFFDLFQYGELIKFDGSRLAANIVTGISFLGSGIIIYKGSIKGLTTAAGIWATAGIGMAIGAGMYGIGIYATVVLLIIQIFIHKFVPIENTVATTIKLKVKNDPLALDHVEDILTKKGADIMTSEIEKKDDIIYCKFDLKAHTSFSFKEVKDILKDDEYIISISL